MCVGVHVIVLTFEFIFRYVVLENLRYISYCVLFQSKLRLRLAVKDTMPTKRNKYKRKKTEKISKRDAEFK